MARLVAAWLGVLCVHSCQRSPEPPEGLGAACSETSECAVGLVCVSFRYDPDVNGTCQIPCPTDQASDCPQDTQCRYCEGLAEPPFCAIAGCS
jgi:hypothetical protein